MRSFVNIIATPKGGTHVSGFERGLVRTVNEQLRAAKLLKVERRPGRSRTTSSRASPRSSRVRLAEPQFEGQTKEVLGTSAATRIVSHVVHRELTKVLTSTKRGDKARARAILEKVVGAARARIAARQSKELQRRKNALETSSLPAKLADCRSDDVERTELFIVEGDSALGTAKLARSSEFQALLPIRGKILNVQKASVADMLKNSECASLIQVLGAGSGRTFDPDAVRYGKVIIMTDADVDGAHIRTLLLTLFHRYMRPMLAAGRVYAAVPPLHRIEVVTGGGKKNEYIYAYTDAEMKKLLADLEKQGQADQAADPAVQGPGRDGRRAAARDHHGPATPHAAADHPGRRRGRAPASSSCSWAMRSRPVATSSSTGPLTSTAPASTPDPVGSRPCAASSP